MKTYRQATPPNPVFNFHPLLRPIRHRLARLRQAFTRVELLVVMATLGLLAAVAVPLVANPGPRGDRIVCANNLRQIGQAFLSWGNEHHELPPWRLTMYEGGNLDHPNAALRRVAYFHYLAVSNELGSPKFLSDPADSRSWRQAATSWGNDPNGLWTLKNKAVSYSLGLHAQSSTPQSLLAGDYNMRTSGADSGCATQIQMATRVYKGVAAWTNAVHGEYGNLLLMDGHVEQTGNVGLREAIDWNNNWNHHFLFPE